MLPLKLTQFQNRRAVESMTLGTGNNWYSTVIDYCIVINYTSTYSRLSLNKTNTEIG